MDGMDCEIKGSETPFAGVGLDPGEAAAGDAGSRCFMDAGIAMDRVFGATGPLLGGVTGGDSDD